MIQKSHFWVYMQNNWKQDFKEIFACPCSQQHIDNSQEVEATQMPINEWMDRHNVVYINNGILFSLNEEGNPVTCYNMDEPLRHYTK